MTCLNQTQAVPQKTVAILTSSFTPYTLSATNPDGSSFKVSQIWSLPTNPGPPIFSKHSHLPTGLLPTPFLASWLPSSHLCLSHKFIPNTEARGVLLKGKNCSPITKSFLWSKALVLNLGLTFCLRGHLARAGDIFSCHTWGMGMLLAFSR